MSLKGWLLGKVHGAEAHVPNGTAVRVDPALRDGETPRPTQAHLGPYAPLIAAIRAELEDFVALKLGLHLAIAERDRYVLTGIEVGADADPASTKLLRHFTAEFTPEQIKRFLARDVIAGLPNASAIDLSQFAGLVATSPPPAAEDPYAALIADLQEGGEAEPRAFDVTLVGRWVHGDAAALHDVRSRAGDPGRGARTPLAAGAWTLRIDDASGARRVELAPIPGRRYVVGKDPDCDVVVDGTYASRRHCELWSDGAGWRVADAGSTNGIRVEAGGAISRSESAAGARAATLELPPRGRLVLSAQALGSPRDHPRMTMEPPAAPAGAAANLGAPATPLAPARRPGPSMVLAASMASGVREIDLAACALPFDIGRSRSQALVVDGVHEDVSGRHVEIVAIDEQGATVVVHGDNGVSIEGAHHGAGERFRWKRGERMLLGRADGAAPACTVTLSTGAAA
jgi:hypothetical protein